MSDARDNPTPHEPPDAPDAVAAPTEVAPVSYRASSPPPRVSAWRRRLRQQFSGDRLRDMGTTLALVAPLTILIWVWAEREEISRGRRQFYVDVRSSDPGRTMTIVDENGKPRGAIDVELTGPRARLDALGDALTKTPSLAYLMLDIDEPLDIGGPYDVALAPLIDRQKLLSDLGVSVVGQTSPEKVRVVVDRQVERELPIRLPPELGMSVQSARIEPATVRVRGPEQVIARLEASGGLTAVLDVVDGDSIKTAPPNTPVVLERVKLRPMADRAIRLDLDTVTRVTMTLSPEVSGEIPLMAIYVAQPAALNVRVRINPPTLTQLKIVGRGDVVKRLMDGLITPRPYAELTFTPDDVGRAGRRQPTLRNLPPGVRVVDGAMPEIGFEVSESTPTSP